jgi:diguanylate cyclase (GGDEF)-like protein/PAS domain S-box-containing protein
MALLPAVTPIAAGPAVSTGEPLLSERVSARIVNLVASAARSLRANGAHFAAGATAEAETLSFADGTTFDMRAAPELARAALGERLLVIDRAERDGTLSGALYEAELHFFASVRVGTEAAPAGYLAIYAREPRSLSNAERCAFLAFAAEIESRLAFDSGAPHTPPERLRFIESVVADSHDATLVTEVEPSDMPGPRIVFANAAFTRITGYEAHEVVGLTPRVLQGSGTDDSARERLRMALQTWQPIEVELLNYRKDRTPFWSELSIVPVADESGSFTHWVSVQRDVTERKANEAAAARRRSAASAEPEYRVFHDGLTGLRNRAYFNDRVKTLLKRLHEDGGQRFAVLVFDIDSFKAINESLGHRVSDRLLIEFARRLEGCTRSRDTLARLGSGEFTCLIEAEGLADVIAVAERIIAALRTPIVLAERETFPSTSIGIAYVDAGYERAADIFRDASAAMSVAKSNGGMRYELFNEAMHADALAALRVQIDLSRALERDEFRLYYQPLVDLHAGHAYGLEALVRWQHPERGLVPPNDFIPVAEETGLIVQIGSWVLHEACRRMRRWHDEAPEREKLTLSVNVSSRQLFDPSFLLELEHALAESELDPRTLILEITESIFLDAAQDIGALFERIKTLGVRIALDDFGTGYSSLSYLERFRFDTLKIDKSFVGRLLSVEATAEIVRLIIGLAGALDMEVVAEGIEDAAQWKALRALGCVRAQGYHFSRPVPEPEVAALLGRPLAAQPRG